MNTTLQSLRLTRDEVCILAGYGPQTLARRIAAGVMPAPVDRGRQALFDRAAVYEALGKPHSEHEPAAEAAESAADPWTVDPDAIREALARKVRHPAPPGGRDVPRVLPGAKAPAALRLVVPAPAAAHR
jgi:hypothetical protein